METVPTIERVEYRQGLGILFKERSRAPAAVVLFFHGGGWFSGNAELVVPYLNQFSKTNFVCASAEYRVRARHGSTVYDSIKDAEDAAAFFRL